MGRPPLGLQGRSRLITAVMPRNRDDYSGGQAVKTVTNDPTKGGDALQMLDDTWWLAYCCCAGLGFASFFEPHMCMNEQKFLCLKCQGSCDFVPFIGQEGMCLDSGKICCIMQSCTFPPSSCFGECLGMGIFGKPKGERGQVEVTTTTTTTTVTARNFGFGGGEEELMKQADLNEFLELAQSVAFAARSSETPLSPSIHNPTWHDERGGLPAALTM